MLIPLKEINEQSLLQKIAKGNILAYETLFNTYWKRLYVYAFNVYNNQVLCEDMVQEVFINLWERREQLTISNLDSYLFRSVKYKMANAIRDLKFTDNHLHELTQIATKNTEYNSIEYKEFQKEIDTLINTLPEKCRNVFIMSRYDQLSNAEIATKLNLSIRTVETHISNALKHLKSNIDVVSLYVNIMLMLTTLQ